MSMYFVKTPEIVKRFYPNQIWSFPSDEKKLYLTFDDGPTPGITQGILKELRNYNAKASFFLVGKNAEQHPELVKAIVKDGHTVGNHTYDHLNGWTSSTTEYLKSVLRTDQVLHSRYFRPPYGRITRSQTRSIISRFRVIMWDVLSGDFDLELSKEKCLKNVTENASQGSIVVFHDSVKAADRMQYALPRALDYFAAKKFSFEALPTTALV